MRLLHTLYLFFFLLNISTSREVYSRQGKITGGHEARPHSNPYIVSLQTRFLWWRTRICSGSILSQQWILTAGHCVTDSWARWFPMDAIVGAHSLAEILSSQIYTTSYRVAHPMYRGDIGPYDIGMVKTTRRIKYSPEVQPISLPVNIEELRADEKLLITGWGATKSSYLYAEIPNKLQEVEVTYLPFQDCYDAVSLIIEENELNPLKRKANMCTGPISGGIAGCQGDSGGPLVKYLSVTPINERMTTTSSISPIPVSTDRPSSTTTAIPPSPIPMTTHRPSSTNPPSPIPMTTDRPTTTNRNTRPPIPMTTNRPSSTTTASTSSPIPMATDRPFSTTTATSPPIPMTTDRPSTTTERKAFSLPITTDKVFSAITDSMSSPNSGTINKLSYSTTARMPSLISLSTFKDISSIKNLSYTSEMIPTVIGVLSWGAVPCGEKGAPTVYSNVTNYMDFINKYLKSSYSGFI